MTAGICIRNKKTGLVLDMSQSIVSIQHYNGKATQLWVLEDNFIRSKQNGYSLDIAGPSNQGSPIITYPSHGGPNQQWYINSDGTISSGIGNLVLDVKDGSLTAGTALCAWPKHGGDNQKFEIITMKK